MSDGIGSSSSPSSKSSKDRKQKRKQAEQSELSQTTTKQNKTKDAKVLLDAASHRHQEKQGEEEDVVTPSKKKKTKKSKVPDEVGRNDRHPQVLGDGEEIDVSKKSKERKRDKAERKKEKEQRRKEKKEKKEKKKRRRSKGAMTGNNIESEEEDELRTSPPPQEEAETQVIKEATPSQSSNKPPLMSSPTTKASKKKDKAETSTVPETPKRPSKTQSLISAINASSSSGQKKRFIVRGTPGREQPLESTDPRERTLEQAEGLTHKEMLVKCLFRGHQLKWLQEAKGLQYKLGKFSSYEDDCVKRALNDFAKEHRMSHAELVRLAQDREDASQAKIYMELWQHVTSYLDGRPNRFVRYHVRRMNLVDQRLATGNWKDDDYENLEKTVHELGEKNWPAIAGRLKRTQEDCRLAYRRMTSEKRARRDWTPDEAKQLKEAVNAVAREQGIVLPRDKKKVSWVKVVNTLNSDRGASECRTKWHFLESESEPKLRWAHPGDDREFLARLKQQPKALEKDDFEEVDFAKLLDGWKPWTSERVRKAWALLVDKYVRKESEPKPKVMGWYYLAYREKFDLVCKGFEEEEGKKKGGEDQVKEDKDAKLSVKKRERQEPTRISPSKTKRRKIKEADEDKSDMIDSEEEGQSPLYPAGGRELQ